MAGRDRRREHERGETLLESLATISILGICMVAILGGIWTTLRVADLATKSSRAETVLRSYAEAVKQPDATDAYHYRPCATASSYPAYDPPAPYDHYVASITGVRYLTGYSAGQPQWSSTCPAQDQGLQELTLRVTGPTNDPSVRATETVTIVKRDATQDVPGGEA